MDVLITHTEPVPANLHDRILDLDRLVIEKHQRTQALESQIAALQREQGELDKTVERAFNLRNDLAQVLNRDDVYDDLMSLLEAYDGKLLS